MTRPDFTDIAPRIEPESGALTGSGVIPNLDPYRANQGDLVGRVVSREDAIFALGRLLQGHRVVHHGQPEAHSSTCRTATAPSLCSALPVGAEPVQLPVHCQPAHQRRRRPNLRRRARGHDADRGRLRRAGELHVLRRGSGQRRSDPGQLGGHVQPDRYFENERLSARLSYTYRSEFFVTFDRSTQLNQDGARVARCLGQREHARTSWR